MFEHLQQLNSQSATMGKPGDLEPGPVNGKQVKHAREKELSQKAKKTQNRGDDCSSITQGWGRRL